MCEKSDAILTRRDFSRRVQSYQNVSRETFWRSFQEIICLIRPTRLTGPVSMSYARPCPSSPRHGNGMRRVHSGGRLRRSARNAPLVQPKPTTFWV